MEEKKVEAKPVFMQPEPTNLFQKFNDDDGIDVPVFLRKNQE